MKFEDWSEVFLEDVAAELTVGFVGSMRSEYIDSGVPFLRSKNIDPYGINWDDMRFIGREFHERLKKSALAPGDVVIVRTGKPGTATLIPKSLSEANCSDVVIVRPGPHLDAAYLVYYLNSAAVHHIDSHLVGAVQQHFNVGAARKLQINLPSLPEQQAIAQVLSSLDDKIDLLHRQNKTLEAIAETLFRQRFIEEAQEDWKEIPLGELLTITSSKRIFYTEYVDFGVPFYRSKEIIELSSSGSTQSSLYITEERFREIDEKFGSPLEGDILLTSVGTLGIPYRVKSGDRFYFKDGNLTWFKDFESLPSVVVFCWLKSSIGREQLDAITIGSTQAALTISGLKEIVLAMPSPTVVKELSTQLDYFYKRVDSNQLKIRTLEKLRDTLLPKLMSGEVRVNLQK